MSEQDTREKLEADIHKWTTRSWVTVSHEKVIDWLNRQAAITRNIERRMHDYILDNLERENDKLIAERNELKEQLRIEREAAGICNGCHYVDGVIAELTAERDELQAAIDAMNNGQFYAMYKAKCEECKEAVSFAKRLENAVNDGQPVTLFGVDYFTSKQNKKLLAEHEHLLKKLKRLRRRLAKAKKEWDYLQKVVKTQAESFKKLECELAGKDG